MSSRPRAFPVPSPVVDDDAARACAQAVLSHVPGLMREIRSVMRRAAPEGLSVPQFRALIHAQLHPDQGVGDLAAHLGVTLPTASVTVSNLAKRGLLTVLSPEGDKRRRAIRLTRAGARAVDAAWAQTATDFTERLRQLPGAQLDDMRRSLGALSTHLNPLP